MIAELVDGREHQPAVRAGQNYQMDVRKYTFPRAGCEHGDLLAKESEQV